MMVSSTRQLTLGLRLGERRIPDGPPDVGAFSRPSSSSSAGEPPPREPVHVLPGAKALEAGAPLRLFIQQAEHGIPLPGQGPSALPLDLRSWSLRPTVFGHLAEVTPTPTRGGAPRSPVAWVVAACLPLVLPLPAVAAAPSPDRPTVQRPASEPSVPAAPGTDGEAGGSVPTPDSEPDPDFVPPEASPESDAEEPEPEVDPTPPPAPSAAVVSLSEQATLDAAWEGVDGIDVELELKGGRTLRGMVGAVQRDTFTLIQHGTGAVLVLPKSGVVTLRAYVPPELPTKSGTGLLVGGGIFVGTGSPVFISGLTILGLCPSCVSINLPLLLVGGAALGAGIPMLVRGSSRRQEYQKALLERGLSPTISRTSHGWMGGLRLRF